MAIPEMHEFELAGKRLIIRQDLNVPIKEGQITSDARIRASLPTIKTAIANNAKVMILSHLGRPVEGEYDETFSLAPVAQRLSELLGQNVTLAKDWLNGLEIEDGEVVLCENVRFNLGEKKNDDALSKQMASLCDLFVMDAFGTAHRAQASTHGIAKYTPAVCAGPLLAAELKALGQALDQPQRPMMAIVGGSKVSTKLTVLESLTSKVDQLIVGGGIANTFLAAKGFNVGKSLYEPDLLDTAKSLMEKISVPLPTDVVVAKEFSESATAVIKPVDQVADDEMILDIGPDSAAQLAKLINSAKTIVWNGPLGVFEFDQFGAGTQALSMAIADSDGFSIAGGGDTLAAVDKYKIKDRVSYISTGGGAFLEFLEGKDLPAVAILQKRNSQ